MPGFPADHPDAGVRAWEGVVCAATGLYPPERFYPPASGLPVTPMFTALPLASNFAAFMAVHRIVGALIARLRTGHGQRIRVSLYEACFQAFGFYAEVPVSRTSFTPQFRRIQRITRPRPTADGRYLYLDVPARGLQTFLDRYLPGFDLLTLTDDSVRCLASALDDLIAEQTAAEWERIGQEEMGAAFGIVQSTSEWLSDRHALDSRSVVAVDDPVLGPTYQAGFPVLLSGTPPTVRCPRSIPDEANHVGWLGPPRTDPPLPPSPTGLPLEGTRVLDCSTLLAGPTTTRVLAQYGVEVIKVDRAGLARGDIDPLTDDEAQFLGGRTVMAGKRMMFLDLKAPGGRDVIHAIAREMDVVHHNFTPAAAARLGLSPDTLRDLNPNAILSTMSLHSHGGFRAEYRGHDQTAQMITGMSTRMGGSAGPRLLPIVVNDLSAGHLNAFGIMLALLHRHRTGTGQAVNASLSRTAGLHQLPFMVSHPGREWDEPAGRDALGWSAVNRLYHAQNGWFFLAAVSADDRAKLAAVPALKGIAGLPDSSVERWLASRFARIPVEACVRALTDAGVSAHRYVELAELLVDEYAIEHGLLEAAHHPGLGRAWGIGHPRFGDGDRPVPRGLRARRPGMDTLDVLEELGLADRSVELLRSGTVAVGEAAVMNTTTRPGYWSDTSGLSPLAGPERLAVLVSRLTAATDHESTTATVATP